MPVHKHRPDPNKSLVGFIVGSVAYAVPISSVKEIVKPLPLTDLPHAPVAVVGVADHRGEVVPVIDLRMRFGVPPKTDPRSTKWILVDSGGKTVGLVVDEVTDVFGTGGAELRPPPTMGGGDDERGIAGVTNYDGRLVFVLDLGKLEVLTRALTPPQLLAEGAP